VLFFIRDLYITTFSHCFPYVSSEPMMLPQMLVNKRAIVSQQNTFYMFYLTLRVECGRKLAFHVFVLCALDLMHYFLCYFLEINLPIEVIVIIIIHLSESLIS
jgi:hypothetical protein